MFRSDGNECLDTPSRAFSDATVVMSLGARRVYPEQWSLHKSLIIGVFLLKIRKE